MSSKKAILVAQKLKQNYPSPKTDLKFANDMQLVIAVMLSAQTTDKKVNQITEKLFQRYISWQDFVSAEISQLEQDIHGVNFHKTKALRIKETATKILEKFQGKVPQKMEDLLTLPGIARKTANVILQEFWDIAEGIVVDTHVTRVSNKLGLVTSQDAKKIEKELMDLIPKEYWRNFSGACVLHGRYVCIARKPKCDECCLKKICPSAEI
jgi:endonuclease-3